MQQAQAMLVKWTAGDGQVLFGQVIEFLPGETQTHIGHAKGAIAITLTRDGKFHVVDVEGLSVYGMGGQ